MMEVLPWRSAASPNDVLRRAAAVLAEGGLVAFPTETVYGLAANALRPDAVARLLQSKGRPIDKPLTVALPDAAAALEWVPGLSPLGRRLARRCWPGPVTLVFGAGLDGGRLDQLSEEVRQRLSPHGTLGLRVPAHAALLDTLGLVSYPVVLTSANRSGEPAAVTAEEVAAAVGDGLDLLIDDGPCYYGQASTVVRVEGAAWTILREGVVPAEELEQLGTRVILFVCTGNTCRSPLAEALCKKLLAERLGCDPAELPRRGYLVLSAGLAAQTGAPAATEAVAAASELGADLSGHVSRPLSAGLAAQADDLIAMTRGHLEMLATSAPGLACQPRLLAGAGADLPDPIGGDQEDYRACARQILGHLESFVAELQLS